MKELG